MDIQEIEALYNKYSHAIYRRAMKFMRNEEEAIEVMQEVFVRAIQYGSGFRGESSPYTWLYRIATHLCLNKIRHNKVTKLSDEPFSEGTFNFGKDPERQFVNQKSFYKIYDQLSEEERTIISCYFMDGMTQEQVADFLGLSRKTIYHRLNDITAKFKEGGLQHGI